MLIKFLILYFKKPNHRNFFYFFLIKKIVVAIPGMTIENLG